ncbi:MAG: radical SAM family heme chaperone HemW [Candidatus Omnitrophota bacterium]
MPKSLYIHIPFCSKKCPYCDFYSLVYDSRLAAAYLKVLCRQIAGLGSDFSTLYIGGGTPSSLSITSLKKLLGSLRLISRNLREFTIEVNPESIDQDKLKLFIEAGVNRISIGVQSFFDPKLKKLGRAHNSEAAMRAIKLAKRAGFKDLGVDLIFGADGEALADWLAELKQAVSSGINHISTYCLTYEKNTPLFLQIKRKFITPLDDGILAKMYTGAVNYLTQQGFEHYEISNFAQPGFESQHNMNYWQGNSYLGLGPAAVSFIGGKRERNISGVIEYIERLNRGQNPVVFSESLSKRRQAQELAAIKVRTKEGIDFEWFKQRTGYDFPSLENKALAQLLAKGLLKYRRKNKQITGVCLTKKGFCFADTVSSSFL